MGERVTLGLRGRAPVMVRACNFTDSSLVLLTDQLDFQDRAMIDFGGVIVDATVAFASHMPTPFAVVAYHLTPEASHRLHEMKRSFPRFEDLPIEYPDQTARDQSESTDPEMTERDDTEKQQVVSLPKISDPSLHTLDQRPPIDTNIDALIQMPSETPIEGILEKALEQPTMENRKPSFPELSKDGRVWFSSREEFRAQVAQNLSRGTIIVRAQPLEIGTKRTLILEVPGARARCSLPCVVSFNGSGVVGFVIDQASAARSSLKALREEMGA